MGVGEEDVSVAAGAGDREGGLSQRELLQAARAEFGWTIQDAAAAVGVSVRTWEMWESESKSSREAPEMLYRLLELNRQLKGKGLPVSWDDINERAAARSGAMLLRPNRAKYGTSKE